jgi:hypothetical protein
LLEDPRLTAESLARLLKKLEMSVREPIA